MLLRARPRWLTRIRRAHAWKEETPMADASAARRWIIRFTAVCLIAAAVPAVAALTADVSK